MKKIILLSVLLIIAFALLAQTPQAFKYQTVVRDISGDVLPNQFISLQISIHDGTAGGTIVYQETHDVTTNQFGLANLEIGLGLPIIGDFISIDWQTGLKFLEIALDPTGGNTYVSMGTSQLFSVPYALYAGSTSNDGDWTISGTDLYTDLSGNVGIGTSNPIDKFEIYSNVDNWNNIRLDNAHGGTNAGSAIYFYENGAYKAYMAYANSGNNNALSGPNSLTIQNGYGPIQIRANGEDPVVLQPYDGKVGIGTSTPGNAKLEVLGDDSNAIHAESSAGGGFSAGYFSGTNSGTYGIWTQSDEYEALYAQTFSPTHPAIRATGTIAGVFDGKVGIGTTSPQATLDVNGSINSLNNYLIDGNSVISVEGERNLMVGVGTGGNNTGTWATFIGDSAGFNNQGIANLFLGSMAGYKNTTGGYNTFVGTRAGHNNIEGNLNTFIGYEAGTDNTSGYYNTYLGGSAGSSNETGKWNTCIGVDAGANTQDAIANTFLGSYCGRNSSVGDSNVFIGFFAGELETGSNKLIIANGPNDDNILMYGDFVSGNLGIGTKDLNHKLNINGNAELRGEDGWDDPGDQANIFMGDPNHGFKGVYGEGLRFWTFDDPGHDIRFQNHTGVDYMTVQMGTGNVGIGTDMPIGKFHVISAENYPGYFETSFTNIDSHTLHAKYSGGTADAIAVYGESKPSDFYGYGGYFTGGYMGVLGTIEPTGSSTYYGINGRIVGGSGINYGVYGSASGSGINYAGYFNGDVTVTGTLTNPSDLKLKKNIQPLNNMLAKIEQVNVYNFEFKNAGDAQYLNLAKTKQMGFIAQEIEQIFPELVSNQVHSIDQNLEKKGMAKDILNINYKGINYIGMIPVLTQAIKEQQEIIDNQQSQIDELKDMVSKLVK